ncbi:hypothetical protein DERP_008540 [Dermatophagoides pteronyssinus]|uniref:Uncharacterized protein n=1 Tax=Dermatophagoides pteronyssinus TaxID=6956 RepID=A0ABQ8IWL9_DERPT|nr:hypothetical protein DERP_008540 [Dermatophagoides pteronyssinus]
MIVAVGCCCLVICTLTFDLNLGQNHFQRCVQFFENDKRKGNTILKIKTIFLCSHVKMYIRVYG